MKKIFTIIGALAMASVAIAQNQNNANAQMLKALANNPINKLVLAESAIRQIYVDSINEDKLVEDAIKGMLKELDPHSAYTPAKEVQALTEPLKGNFEGIGIQYNMVEDTLVVVQPVSGGPSEKVGIMAGDRVVFVNDSSIAGQKLTTDDIKARLRGPKGSKVKLGVMRQGVKGIHNFTVTRDKIPVYSIDAKYMIDASTGYIRITNFAQNTHTEFVEAVKMLKDKGMTDLVLDLQGNGGGYLSAAVEISNEFLNAGDMIVFTEGRAMPRHDYKADGQGILRTGKVVVLIDSYTASASEIVSGAVQDNDRGVIIGRRSFGKGLVQRPIDFPDGSMVRLTIAHYYSPSGRCIQKPYEKGQGTDYNKDLQKRLDSGELTNADSIHFADSLRFSTLKNHRTVYAAGGIMPDIYVPLDTTIMTRLYRELLVKSCLTQTNMKYIDKNRKQLKKQYKHFADFKKDFEVGEDAINILKECAAKAKVEYPDSDWQETMPLLKLQLKGLIARDIWDISEYHEIVNEINDIYQRGIKVIKTEEYYDKLSN